MAVGFTLRQLEYVVTVADCGSISSAAAMLHTSPAAVSLGISDLENKLGIQILIRRSAKPATFTQAGWRILNHARALLQSAEELQSEARESQEGLSGRLVVGCYSTLAPFWIPLLLREFVGAHPALELEVLEGSSSDLLQRLAGGSAELALMYEYDVEGDVETVPIRQQRPYIILAADHPLALAPSPAVRLADLLDDPLIMFDAPSARSALQVLESAGFSATPRHVTSNIEVVRGLVARNLGYSIVVQRWANGVSVEGLPLVAKEIAEDVKERTIVLAWSRGARLSRRARAMIDFCKAAGVTPG